MFDLYYLYASTVICLIFSPMSFAESVVPNNLVAENNSLNYDMEPSSEYAPNQLYEYVWKAENVRYGGVTTGAWQYEGATTPATKDGIVETYGFTRSYSHSFSGNMAGIPIGILEAAVGFSFGSSVSYSNSKSIPLLKNQYVKWYTATQVQIQYVTMVQYKYPVGVITPPTKTGATREITTYKQLIPFIKGDIHY